jgi:hypothetical protein
MSGPALHLHSAEQEQHQVDAGPRVGGSLHHLRQGRGREASPRAQHGHGVACRRCKPCSARASSRPCSQPVARGGGCGSTRWWGCTARSPARPRSPMGPRPPRTSCSEIIKEESIQFRWEKGDVLILDNLATHHGRRPLLPPKRVLVTTCK